jgi:glucose-1-phosphate thymidylyltransferase
VKAVLLSGGNGTRLRPITYSMPKQLVPVANKPVLFYGLEHMADAGIKDVGIVISPETGDEVRAAVGDGSMFGVRTSYIVQPRPLGLADALRTALEFVDGDDCLMYLGDNLLRQGVIDVVEDFERHRPNCQILLSPVDDPRAFGVAELDAERNVRRLVEKPAVPRSDLALVGVYLFDPTVGEAVGAIAPSPRGEFEITDAIQYLIDTGRHVRATLVDGWWKDTGKKEDLLHANELILQDLTDDIRGEVVRSALRGPVQLGSGSILVDCEVEGPVVIGDASLLTGVQIGSFTSIGNSCRLEKCAVASSVIMDGSEISGWDLRRSLIGTRVVLRGALFAGVAELTLGERCEIFESDRNSLRRGHVNDERLTLE